MRQSLHIFAVALVLLLAIMVLGTAGFHWIEGWSLIESLYMTVITVATVGFSEVHPLSDGGRLFTIVLILLGVGFFLYAAGAAIQFMVEGRIRNVLGRMRLNKKINHLRDHYIVCGYGRIGRALCRFLRQKESQVVVIDQDRERVAAMEEDGVLFVIGDATDEANLHRAGVERAKGLITAVGSDAHNVFLVLTAKQLNPNLFVVSRANQRETKKTLKAAGADKVVSPFEIGGQRMAHAILRPTVIHFLDLAFADQETDIHIEEIPVHSSSELIDVSLQQLNLREKLDLLIVACRRADGTMHFNPSAQTHFQAGDTVIAMGQNDNLAKLETALNP